MPKIDPHLPTFIFFFFNDTATTEIYTLSLHDALPIWGERFDATWKIHGLCQFDGRSDGYRRCGRNGRGRSEEHTSELQSQSNLVCRLLLEKKTVANELRNHRRLYSLSFL